MGACRSRARLPHHRGAQRAPLALDAAARPRRLGVEPARRPRRMAVPARHGGGYRAAGPHRQRDRGHGPRRVDRSAAVECSRSRPPGADGHPRRREAAQGAGGTPGTRLGGLPVSVGSRGRRHCAGPRPGADPPARHGATVGKAICPVRRAPGADDGLGAPGRDGSRLDGRRRRSVNRGGGNPGRRSPARPLSPGQTPRTSSAWSRGVGRTAG
jgi:hypothetical protein